jgi:uncharacterized protein YecT (DUF1311 family)
MKECILRILLVFGFASLAPNAFSQTQAELNREAAAQFERADAQLNDIYKRVLAAAAVDEERQQKLIKAQRAWLVYRDAEAEFEADEVRGGTAYSMEYNGARTKLTEERVKALREILALGDEPYHQIASMGGVLVERSWEPWEGAF